MQLWLQGYAAVIWQRFFFFFLGAGTITAIIISAVIVIVSAAMLVVIILLMKNKCALAYGQDGSSYESEHQQNVVSVSTKQKNYLKYR